MVNFGDSLALWPDPYLGLRLEAGSLIEINVDQFGSTLILMSWRAELFSSDRPSRIRSFVGAIPSNVMTQVTCWMISWKKSYLRVFGLGNFLNFLECSRLIRRKRGRGFRKGRFPKVYLTLKIQSGFQGGSMYRHFQTSYRHFKISQTLWSNRTHIKVEWWWP